LVDQNRKTQSGKKKRLGKIVILGLALMLTFPQLALTDSRKKTSKKSSLTNRDGKKKLSRKAIKSCRDRYLAVNTLWKDRLGPFNVDGDRLSLRSHKIFEGQIFELFNDPSFLTLYFGISVRDPHRYNLMETYGLALEQGWVETSEGFDLDIPIFNSQNDEFIGVFNATVNRKTGHSMEIGLGILSLSRGKGFGAEAINRFVKQIKSNFTEITEVTAHIFPINNASIQLFKSVGFKSSGSFDPQGKEIFVRLLR